MTETEWFKENETINNKTWSLSEQLSDDLCGRTFFTACLCPFLHHLPLHAAPPLLSFTLYSFPGGPVPVRLLSHTRTHAHTPQRGHLQHRPIVMALPDTAPLLVGLLLLFHAFGGEEPRHSYHSCMGYLSYMQMCFFLSCKTERKSTKMFVSKAPAVKLQFVFCGNPSEKPSKEILGSWKSCSAETFLQGSSYRLFFQLQRCDTAQPPSFCLHYIWLKVISPSHTWVVVTWLKSFTSLIFWKSIQKVHFSTAARL